MRQLTAVCLLISTFAPAASVPAAREFGFRMDVSKVAPRRLQIVATTDLPDGAIVTVHVWREYDETIRGKYLPTEIQTAVGEIFSKDIVVTRGRVEAIADVDDRSWMRQRGARALRMASAEIFISAVRNVRPRVEVSAMYTPYNKNQPVHVIAVTGQKGELIKNATEGVRTLHALKLVSISFNGGDLN